MIPKINNAGLYDLIDKAHTQDEFAFFKPYILHCIDGTPLFVRAHDFEGNRLVVSEMNFVFELSVSGDNDDRLAMYNTPDGAIITLRPAALANFNALTDIFADDFVSSVSVRSLATSGYGYKLIDGDEKDADLFVSNGHSLSMSKTRGRDDFSFDLEVFEQHAQGTAMEGQVSIGDIPLTITDIRPETKNNKSLIDVSSLAINTLVWGRENDVESIKELMGDGFTSSRENKAHIVTAIEHYFERQREPDAIRIAKLMAEADLTLDDIHIERSFDELSAALNQILLSDSNKKLKINKLKL